MSGSLSRTGLRRLSWLGWLGWLMTASVASSASAGTIGGAYTTINDKNCRVVARAADENDGDWSESRCKGYGDYPVTIFHQDTRESVFFGFMPSREPRFETFAGFNSVGDAPKVEWRLEAVSQRAQPFATILRWRVMAEPNDLENLTDVLVVSKVAQKGDRSGCVVGLVVATGNPDANSDARRIADERARAFRCGEDEPMKLSGKVPMPELMQ